MATVHQPRAAAAVLEALLKRDDDEERWPARLSGFQYMAVFMRSGMRPRTVPAANWTVAHTEDNSDSAVVRCHCDAEVRVNLAAYPVQCACKRWFFYDGTAVWSLVRPAQEA